MSSNRSPAERIRSRRHSDPNFDLVLTLLISALKDIGALQHGNRKNHTRKRHWEDAATWFKGTHETPPSFRWVCDIVGFDPDIALFWLGKRTCGRCGVSLLGEWCRCRWKKNADKKNSN